MTLAPTLEQSLLLHATSGAPQSRAQLDAPARGRHGAFLHNPVRIDLRGDVARLVLAACQQDDLGAAGRDRPRGRRSESLRCARDEHCAAGQLHVANATSARSPRTKSATTAAVWAGCASHGACPPGSTWRRACGIRSVSACATDTP